MEKEGERQREREGERQRETDRERERERGGGSVVCRLKLDQDIGQEYIILFHILLQKFTYLACI